MPVGALDADALLSLPQEILDEVLARLNLRDAVRTSALCRAWRRRWETIPSIDICPSGKQVLWTVDCVLSRCSGRVRCFHVSLDELSARRLDDWLLVLSRRGGVEDLYLRPVPQPYEFFSRLLLAPPHLCRPLRLPHPAATPRLRGLSGP